MEDAFELELKFSVISKLEKIRLNDSTASCCSFQNDTENNSSSPGKQHKHKEEHKITEELNQNENSRSKNPTGDILNLLEMQRRKDVESNFQSRLQKMEDFSKKLESNKRIQLLQKQQEFAIDMQQKENRIFQVLEEYDRSSSDTHAQLALYYKNSEIRKQVTENEIKKKQKEKQMICNCIDKIRKLQPVFRSVYEEILKDIKKCVKREELKEIHSGDFKLLNVLVANFEEVVNLCRRAKVSEADAAKAADMCSQLENLEKRLNDSVEKINEKVINENKPKPIEPIPVKVSSNEPKTIQSTEVDSKINKYVSVTNFKIYTQLLDFLKNYLQSFKSLENDASQKSFILDCKKAVNIPVNSLSGVNAEHIQDKYNKLYKLLKGEDVMITNKRINASQQPQGIAFCKNLLAKRLVLQSDLIVSSNPESAFCYATVIMSLWNEFPDFGQLILAYFYKTCPGLVPYHILRQVGETEEEFYQRQGYQYNNGEIEKQDKFLKRMTGVMRLYAAILVVKPKRGHKNIYNIQNGWRWLAATLKLEPQIDISATLVHTFLEFSGFEMEAAYGKMFHKLIQIIKDKFIPSCREKCTGGAVTRLELLMTEFLQKRKFESPDGYLAYNYW